MSLDRSNTRDSVSKGFVDDLNGAIRENPVAAGLIGMGVLWMFFGGARVSAFGGKLPGAAKSVAGAVGAVADAGGNAVGGGLSAAGSHVAGAARKVGDSISSGVQGVGTFVRDTLAAGYDAASETVSGSVGQTAGAMKGSAHTSAQSGMEMGTSLQQNLSATLQRQPLLLGAIGLAIGAGLASAFPSTKVESSFMGEAGAAVKEKIQEFASDTSELVTTKAKQVLDDVKKEAEVQGLTPSAAKEALQGAAEKVKTVAGSTRESAKGRLT